MQDSTPVKREDAKAFCDCCEWLHTCWSMCLAVYEAAKRHEPLPDLTFWKSPAGQFLEHHGMICNEYTLLQFAKLHDRPSVGGNWNLVIRHFTQRDDWPGNDWEEIKQVSRRLDEFYHEYIKGVRDKILAHSDLETYRDNTLLGEFPETEGEEYFRNLGRFASMVWTRWQCETDSPFQGAAPAFDFTPGGPARRECKEVAERAVACIQLGWRELHRSRVAAG